MKNFLFLNTLLIFLIFIHKVYSINGIEECPEGTYGINCEKKCECDKWSSNRNCSRIAGKCLGCKFGHFGKNCEQICYPRCKTNLCCSMLSDSKKEDKKIKLNISMLKIKVDNQELNILPDYNVGHTLTIFNKTLSKNLNLKNKQSQIETIQYTNYNAEGNSYLNNSISLIDVDKDNHIDLQISILLDTTITNKEGQNINGVIGLGYLNSINDELFRTNSIGENIISYSINEDQIDIIFGNIFDEEKGFINKLGYCNIVKGDNFGITSEVSGIKAKGYSGGLKINETNVKFSLDEKSSFILSDNIDIKFYIKKYFFNDRALDDEDKTKASSSTNYKEIIGADNTTYFCLKKDIVNNKLSNFGFIINDFYYSYEPKFFFVEEEKCDNDQMKFIVGFNSNKNKGIIFGKDILKNTKFTIDNEERKIYFYTRNVEYFSDSYNFYSIPTIDIEPMKLSLFVTLTIFLLNVISFLIYFFIKRKKEKIN